MEPRVHFVTFATRDLDAARAFYRDALAWRPLLDVPGEIIFFQVGPGLVLGLFDARKFDEDVGRGGAPAVSGVTLSHNVDRSEAVDRIVTAALASGATLIKAPVQAAFGGYHGHFGDPNGIIWEIAYNPDWRVDESGTVLLGP